MEKKKISIIALDPRAGRSYGRDVESLFGDVAEVSVFSVMDGSAMGVLERADLFAASTDAFGSAEELARHVPMGCQTMAVEASFRWSRLRKLKEIPADGTLKLTVKVTNKGSMDGEEIVQLYVRDRFSQVTRPVKELKDFARVALKPGETRTVEFTVTPDKLRFLDRNLEPVVEPGEFILMAGPSSDDRDLLKTSVHVIE